MTCYVNIEEFDYHDHVIDDCEAKLYSKDGKEGKDDCGILPVDMFQQQQGWQF